MLEAWLDPPAHIMLTTMPATVRVNSKHRDIQCDEHNSSGQCFCTKQMQPLLALVNYCSPGMLLLVTTTTMVECYIRPQFGHQVRRGPHALPKPAGRAVGI